MTEASKGGTGIAGAMDHRPPTERGGPSCFVCGAEIEGASLAARAVHGYGLAQVCSPACRDHPSFARPGLVVPEERSNAVFKIWVRFERPEMFLSQDTLVIAVEDWSLSDEAGLPRHGQPYTAIRSDHLAMLRDRVTALEAELAGLRELQG